MYRVIYLRMLKTCWVYRFKQNSEIKCFFSHCRRCSEKETPWKLLRLDSKFNFENMTSYKDVSMLPSIQAGERWEREPHLSPQFPSTFHRFLYFAPLSTIWTLGTGYWREGSVSMHARYAFMVYTCMKPVYNHPLLPGTRTDFFSWGKSPIRLYFAYSINRYWVFKKHGAKQKRTSSFD